MLTNRPLKRFACGDVVPGCRRSFLGTDDDDVLTQVAGHAAADHGLLVVPEEVVVAVRRHIVTVD